MKITKKELMGKDTWFNRQTRTILTADITWLSHVGEVHHGLNMKKNMTEEEFREAMGWKDPGDYILENFAAAGTGMPGRLTMLSIDEAYDEVTSSEGWESHTYDEHDFNYEIFLWCGAGYWPNAPMAFNAEDPEDALVKASLADDAACVLDEDDPEAKEAQAFPDLWVYLDRSEYDSSNAYLYIVNAKVEKLD